MLDFYDFMKNNYNLSITGDSGYCLRKIYGRTRLHADRVINNHNKTIRVDNSEYVYREKFTMLKLYHKSL